MDFQEQLLKAIRSKVKDQSINETIADVLNISYDAAHRRVSLKSKFSIQETVQLCQYFHFSMDHLFQKQTQQLIVQKTHDITSANDLVQYFKQSVHNIKPFADTYTTLIYSAKDLPIFYTIGGTLLSKFKLFVWLNLLSANDQTPFELFYLPKDIVEYSLEMNHIYSQCHSKEVWNDTTINSTIQQILYYYQSGLLSFTNAQLLYEDVLEILHIVEEKCLLNPDNYHLFYNEILILNNNVLLHNAQISKLFVPYTMLGYFITEDKQTIDNAKQFFEHQVKSSKSLNLSGTKDRKQFFNKARQKVQYYQSKLTFDLEL